MKKIVGDKNWYTTIFHPNQVGRRCAGGGGIP
jgi:hypothetical protein